MDFDKMRARVCYPFVYRWRNNSKRRALFKRPCAIMARGPANSRLIMFDDGQREIVSGNALRQRRPWE